MTVLFVTWGFLGILTYGLFWFNLMVSPQAQRNISSDVIKGYTGGSLIEDILLFCLLLFVLICALVGGPLGLSWQYTRSVQIRKNRKAVEDKSENGWCV